MAKKKIFVRYEYKQNDSSIVELINWLQQHANSLERSYVDIPENDWGDGLIVGGYRDETDQERKNRLAKARNEKRIREEAKRTAEEKEREHLRNLLKKYPEEVHNA